MDEEDELLDLEGAVGSWGEGNRTVNATQNTHHGHPNTDLGLPGAESSSLLHGASLEDREQAPGMHASKWKSQHCWAQAWTTTFGT